MIYTVAVVATSYSGGSPTALNVFDISDITQFFVNLKPSPISQLIHGKSRNLQKLLKYFNGTTTSASNILSLFGVFPIIYIRYLKNLLSLSSISLAESFTSSL